MGLQAKRWSDDCYGNDGDLWFIRNGDVVVAGLSSGKVDQGNSTTASMSRLCVRCGGHINQTMSIDADEMVHIQGVGGQCSGIYYIKEGSVLGVKPRSHARKQRQLRGSDTS